MNASFNIQESRQQNMGLDAYVSIREYVKEHTRQEEEDM